MQAHGLFSEKYMEQLRLYQIDMKYVRDLHNADDRVESVSPQIGKASRVFVGVVITHNNRKYCIPLSHPKEKHKKMSQPFHFSNYFKRKP